MSLGAGGVCRVDLGEYMFGGRPFRLRPVRLPLVFGTLCRIVGWPRTP